jgi:hypothetical protein
MTEDIMDGTQGLETPSANLGQKLLLPFQLLNSLYDLKLETLFPHTCNGRKFSVRYRSASLKPKDHSVCAAPEKKKKKHAFDYVLDCLNGLGNTGFRTAFSMANLFQYSGRNIG